jgi:protein-tyrosine-phosphatase
MRKILFLCPHNAAKSILAAAYCKVLANQQGLELSVDTAGTEPSSQVSPKVLEFLNAQNMHFTTTPRLVTRSDIASATQIISMGCDLHDLPLQGESVEQWNGITATSENLEASWAQIKSNVDALLKTTR